MDLSLTAKEEEYRTRLRSWLEKNVDREWRRKYKSLEEQWTYFRAWDKVLFEGGWGGIEWPLEYGGTIATAFERAIFAEENARIDAPEGLARIGKRLTGPAIMLFGTPQQKAHLPKILRGDEVWCQGFSEPHAGTDLASLRTKAERSGDRWIVNGTKIWTSFAQYADWCFLLARTGELAQKHETISVFLLDLKTPGIHLRPLRTMTGEEEFNETTLTNVEIPDDCLLGSVNEGWHIVTEVLACERDAQFSLRRFMGVRRSLERMLAQRRAKGGDENAERLGRLYARAFGMQLLAYELLTYEAAKEFPRGFGSMVKLFVTEGFREQGAQEIESMVRDDIDAYGIDEGGEWLFDYLESMHYTISGGTSEVQRNTVARQMLELPSSTPRKSSQ